MGRIFKSETLQDEFEGNALAISYGKGVGFFHMMLGSGAFVLTGFNAVDGIKLSELAAGLATTIYGLTVSFMVLSAADNAETNLRNRSGR